MEFNFGKNEDTLLDNPIEKIFFHKKSSPNRAVPIKANQVCMITIFVQLMGCTADTWDVYSSSSFSRI